MFGKMLLYAMSLPFAIICCFLAPIIYITVIAVSPLGLLYRYILRPLFAGDEGADSTIVVHRPIA